jgi:uncharacterized protein
MPHFVVYCIDSDRAADLRPQHRPAHLDHLRGSGMVRLAGPMSDDAGKTIGSLLIVEADDLAAARAFSEADPFRKLGVYQSVDIHPFAISVLDLPASA